MTYNEKGADLAVAVVIAQAELDNLNESMDELADKVPIEYLTKAQAQTLWDYASEILNRLAPVLPEEGEFIDWGCALPF